MDTFQKHFATQRSKKNTYCLVPCSDFQEQVNLSYDFRKQNSGGLQGGTDFKEAQGHFLG